MRQLWSVESDRDRTAVPPLPKRAGPWFEKASVLALHRFAVQNRNMKQRDSNKLGVQMKWHNLKAMVVYPVDLGFGFSHVLESSKACT